MQFDTASDAVRWAFNTEGLQIVSGSRIGEVSHSLGGDMCRDPQALTGFDKIAQSASIIRRVLELKSDGDPLVAHYTLAVDPPRIIRKLEAAARVVAAVEGRDNHDVAKSAVSRVCHIEALTINEVVSTGVISRAAAFKQQRKIVDRFYTLEDQALALLTPYLRDGDLIP